MRRKSCDQLSKGAKSRRGNQGRNEPFREEADRKVPSFARLPEETCSTEEGRKKSGRGRRTRRRGSQDGFSTHLPHPRVDLLHDPSRISSRSFERLRLLGCSARRRLVVFRGICLASTRRSHSDFHLQSFLELSVDLGFRRGLRVARDSSGREEDEVGDSSWVAKGEGES